MRSFNGEFKNFSLNKCLIYTHDSASAKFSTNAHETVTVYSQSPLQLCLEVSILQTHATSYSFYSSVTVHCRVKGGKPDRKPYPLPYGLKKSIQKFQACEPSRLCPETSTKLYVHEFCFWLAYIPETHSQRQAVLLDCLPRLLGNGGRIN
jgi:hypothetical protein